MKLLQDSNFFQLISFSSASTNSKKSCDESTQIEMKKCPVWWSFGPQQKMQFLACISVLSICSSSWIPELTILKIVPQISYINQTLLGRLNCISLFLPYHLPTTFSAILQLHSYLKWMLRCFCSSVCCRYSHLLLLTYQLFVATLHLICTALMGLMLLLAVVTDRVMSCAAIAMEAVAGLPAGVRLSLCTLLKNHSAKMWLKMHYRKRLHNRIFLASMPQKNLSAPSTSQRMGY